MSLKSPFMADIIVGICPYVRDKLRRPLGQAQGNFISEMGRWRGAAGDFQTSSYLVIMWEYGVFVRICSENPGILPLQIRRD
jgi:hypothetical protein